MKKLSILAASAAVLLLSGCAAPQPGAAAGVYKGSLKNVKLAQDTAAELIVEEGRATLYLPKLTEQNKPCRAAFAITGSKVAGAGVYKGDFADAIGVCRVFAQEPGVERFMLLRGVGDQLEVVISRDSLGQKPLISGLIK